MLLNFFFLVRSGGIYHWNSIEFEFNPINFDGKQARFIMLIFKYVLIIGIYDILLLQWKLFRCYQFETFSIRPHFMAFTVSLNSILNSEFDCNSNHDTFNGILNLINLAENRRFEQNEHSHCTLRVRDALRQLWRQIDIEKSDRESESENILT